MRKIAQLFVCLAVVGALIAATNNTSEEYPIGYTAEYPTADGGTITAIWNGTSLVTEDGRWLYNCSPVWEGGHYCWSPAPPLPHCVSDTRHTSALTMCSHNLDITCNYNPDCFADVDLKAVPKQKLEDLPEELREEMRQTLIEAGILKN